MSDLLKSITIVKFIDKENKNRIWAGKFTLVELIRGYSDIYLGKA